MQDVDSMDEAVNTKLETIVASLQGLMEQVANQSRQLQSVRADFRSLDNGLRAELKKLDVDLGQRALEERQRVHEDRRAREVLDARIAALEGDNLYNSELLRGTHVPSAAAPPRRVESAWSSFNGEDTLRTVVTSLAEEG